jgi:DNA-binding NarL/FixJ family response regulator
VVVVDVSMPGMNGAQVTTRLLQFRPDRKVIALTVHEEAGYVRMLLDAGAVGYVPKRAAAADLVRAIQTVAAGGVYVDPTLAAATAGAGEPPREPPAEVPLSEREAAVVRMIALGYSNKEIAARLGLSVKTVETYKARSMEKIGLRTRVGLVQYASARGWLAGA